jgi:hypothetical protein
LHLPRGRAVAGDEADGSIYFEFGRLVSGRRAPTSCSSSGRAPGGLRPWRPRSRQTVSLAGLAHAPAPPSHERALSLSD